MDGTWGVTSPCGLHAQPPLYTISDADVRADVRADADAGADAGAEVGADVAWTRGGGRRPLRKYVPRRTGRDRVRELEEETAAEAGDEGLALLERTVEYAAVFGHESGAMYRDVVRRPSLPYRSPYQRSRVPVTENQRYGWEAPDPASLLYRDTSRYPIVRSAESKFGDAFAAHGLGASLSLR